MFSDVQMKVTKGLSRISFCDTVTNDTDLSTLTYKDIRVIVDCTEIFIQRPKNLCCQVITYSQYKNSNTIKFMTGVTPAGTISFVSKCYGGRVSYTPIFEQSRLIDLLERTS